jgi:predicted type IV restriction endonuclease
LNPGSWEQRKFFSIELLQQQENEIIHNLISFISKESVVSGKASEAAKKVYQSNQKEQVIYASLPKAWNSLIKETNESLIELVNDTNEKLCGYRATDEQIAAFLDENKQLLLDITPGKAISRKQPTVLEKSNDYEPTGYTGKRPVTFAINNKTIHVKYWRDILVEICKFLYNNHQDIFEQKISSVKGRKRVYFSKNKNELRVPMQIKSSGFFVEANLSANSIVKLSENLATLFGYDSELHIKVND